MAQTKDITIKGKRIPNRLIDYILNPEKTMHTRIVDGDIEFISLTSSWNCSLQNATEKMNKTFEDLEPHRLNQRKTLGWHFEQSFPAEEKITAVECYQIGCELIERVFGKENPFEIILGTHKDKAHLHNHFFVSAISSVDGHRLRNDYKGIYEFYNKVKNTSDEICREKNLSVIGETYFVDPEKKKEKNSHFLKWEDERLDTKGSFYISKRDIVKKDIDSILGDCNSFEEFLEKLKTKNYTIRNGKHISIKRTDFERPVRLNKLGTGYDEKSIKLRIEHPEVYEKISFYTKEDFWTTNIPNSTKYNIFPKKYYIPKSTYKILCRLHFRKMYAAGRTYKNLNNTHPVSARAIAEFKKRTTQFMYMQKNNIRTLCDLENHLDTLAENYASAFFAQRKVYKESATQIDPILKNEWDLLKKEVNSNIKSLRRQINICQRIGKNNMKVQEKIETLRKEMER